jgi:hypothetical protein
VYYGLADYKDKHLPKDLARAALMFERACAPGKTDTCCTKYACTNLANMYREGDQVPKDIKRAVELDEQACDHGSMEGCANLAQMLANGIGVPKSLQRAVELDEQACDNGVMRGCANLAQMLENGIGVPKNLGRAVRLFERECDHGDSALCNRLGWIYLLGRGVAKNAKLGLAALNRSCKPLSKGQAGCDSYAFALLNGIGTQRDEAHALGLFEKACEAGIKESCAYAGLMHLLGRATEQNASRADELFKAACKSDSIAEWEETCSSHGSPEECGLAGLIWHTGACGQSDPRRAAPLLAKVCRNGWLWPCQRAKEFKGIGIPRAQAPSK